MPTSADTVLRLIRRLSLPKAEAPHVVAVDDWAMRKGRSYGTIVVDLERQCVADLLADRTSATTAEWLQQHPEVAVVARDRSTEYARAATLGAPGAVQVADRWHLLANMRQALERWLHTVHARLRRLPLAGNGRTSTQPRREHAFRRTGPERVVRAERHTRWQARYEEVRRRHLAGEPLLAIARAMDLARATVRKFARGRELPRPPPALGRLRRPSLRGIAFGDGPGPSILDPFLPHLEHRLAEGCENGMALWRELRGMGFPGSSKQVHRWLAERRTALSKFGRRAATNDARPSAREKGPPLPAPRQLAWTLVQPAAALGATDTAVVSRVEQDAEARIAAALARRFTALVCACGVAGRRKGGAPAEPGAELDAWLADARTCGISAIETFAAGLETDSAAVRAALTETWSSGQAEGQVNRLKLLKRQSYGRASFDLLRRRVLLAA